MVETKLNCSKIDLPSLKFGVDKIDMDQLKIVSADLSKLLNAM